MQFVQATLTQGRQTLFESVNWSVETGQCWAILGGNAAGKSSLARVLCGELTLSAGELKNPSVSCLWLSLESQQALYERELYRDETDLMDRIDEGTSLRQLLEEIAPWSEYHHRICEWLDVEHLLERGYRRFSNGEARRVMLARALVQRPEMLILDEPFEGLDENHTRQLHAVLNRLVDAGQWLMLVVNQIGDIIDRCEHVAIMDRGRLRYSGTRPPDLAALWRRLANPEREPLELPPRESDYQLPAWPADRPLVEIQQGAVKYGDSYQFQGLDWCLLPGEHTQIAGENGSGKSTLLGLITGDHPQCYRNQLQVLGFRRGSGESIWQLKKHMGYVSGSLHRDYRVTGSALSAVLSGLTDSIGLYSKVDYRERALAIAWLDIVGLADCATRPLRALSMGQQRLALIARALIKQPPLLILDEPTEGLDDFNRYAVIAIIERIIAAGDTTLLWVSHRPDERPACLKKRLQFVRSERPDTLFEVEQYGVEG